MCDADEMSLAASDGDWHPTLTNPSSTPSGRVQELVYQVVVPGDQFQPLMHAYHTQMGHQGQERTLSLLRRHFFWPRMEATVGAFIQDCPRCFLLKTRKEGPTALRSVEPPVMGWAVVPEGLEVVAAGEPLPSPPRRSQRENRGQPPERYGELTSGQEF
ncbi:hypothetical protein E1301_Tti019935 [Triplophysa tibetana]|uniref:Gypsy retrotransposon integrase-like protein 1 n=1 Tax=Triplophysa tibetana TaxID=1572043 RepID=A0A5A9PQA6_9TELE|nr:hypothetical protein E1301_Tti019935 [Triplophysa tibetana]